MGFILTILAGIIEDELQEVVTTGFKEHLINTFGKKRENIADMPALLIETFLSIVKEYMEHKDIELLNPLNSLATEPFTAGDVRRKHFAKCFKECIISRKEQMSGIKDIQETPFLEQLLMNIYTFDAACTDNKDRVFPRIPTPGTFPEDAKARAAALSPILQSLEAKFLEKLNQSQVSYSIISEIRESKLKIVHLHASLEKQKEELSLNTQMTASMYNYQVKGGNAKESIQVVIVAANQTQIQAHNFPHTIKVPTANYGEKSEDWKPFGDEKVYPLMYQLNEEYDRFAIDKGSKYCLDTMNEEKLTELRCLRTGIVWIIDAFSLFIPDIQAFVKEMVDDCPIGGCIVVLPSEASEEINNHIIETFHFLYPHAHNKAEVRFHVSDKNTIGLTLQVAAQKMFAFPANVGGKMAQLFL